MILAGYVDWSMRETCTQERQARCGRHEDREVATPTAFAGSRLHQPAAALSGAGSVEVSALPAAWLAWRSTRLHFRGATDDVIVGHNVAGRVPDKAAALACTRASHGHARLLLSAPW